MTETAIIVALVVLGIWAVVALAASIVAYRRFARAEASGSLSAGGAITRREQIEQLAKAVAKASEAVESLRVEQERLERLEREAMRRGGLEPAKA